MPRSGPARSLTAAVALLAACGVAAAVAAATLTAADADADAYRNGPPPAHTGGFGEPACGACHQGAPGPSAGSLEILVPPFYRPGKEHDVTVVLRDPDMAAAGFQLAVRHADGVDEGSQAGDLTAPAGAAVVVVSVGGIQYAGHVLAGTDVSDGQREWRLRWRAPDSGDHVVFHAAANAANDDDSQFGDRVYETVHSIRTSGDKRAGLLPARLRPGR